MYDRVYLSIILLHVLLRNLEQPSLSFLHKAVYVNSRVKGVCLYAAGIRDKLTGKKLLSQNLGMIFYVRRGCYKRA